MMYAFGMALLRVELWKIIAFMPSKKCRQFYGKQSDILQQTGTELGIYIERAKV